MQLRGFLPKVLRCNVFIFFSLCSLLEFENLVAEKTIDDRRGLVFADFPAPIVVSTFCFSRFLCAWIFNPFQKMKVVVRVLFRLQTTVRVNAYCLLYFIQFFFFFWYFLIVYGEDCLHDECSKWRNCIWNNVVDIDVITICFIPP